MEVLGLALCDGNGNRCLSQLESGWCRGDEASEEREDDGEESMLRCALFPLPPFFLCFRFLPPLLLFNQSSLSLYFPNINININIINNSNIGIRNKRVKHVAAAQTEQCTGGERQRETHTDTLSHTHRWAFSLSFQLSLA